MMSEEQRQKLELLRKQRAAKPTPEDYVALVEACFEQDMSIHDTVREVRGVEGCGLVEGVRWLQLAVTKSTTPACAERRQRVLRIGRF